eukprot:4745779-Amphidinium_carterae.1
MLQTLCTLFWLLSWCPKMLPASEHQPCKANACTHDAAAPHRCPLRQMPFHNNQKAAITHSTLEASIAYTPGSTAPFQHKDNLQLS